MGWVEQSLLVEETKGWVEQKQVKRLKVENKPKRGRVEQKCPKRIRLVIGLSWA